MLENLRRKTFDDLSDSAVSERASDCATYVNKFRQFLKPQYKFDHFEKLEENFSNLVNNEIVFLTQKCLHFLNHLIRKLGARRRTVNT